MNCPNCLKEYKQKASLTKHIETCKVQPQINTTKAKRYDDLTNEEIIVLQFAALSFKENNKEYIKQLKANKAQFEATLKGTMDTYPNIEQKMVKNQIEKIVNKVDKNIDKKYSTLTNEEIVILQCAIVTFKSSDNKDYIKALKANKAQFENTLSDVLEIYPKIEQKMVKTQLETILKKIEGVKI